VFDRTTTGSQLKWLSVVDEYTRECLALKVDRGITSEDVINTLAELFAMRGVPRHIRSDNGPEFIAQTLRRWLKQVGVGTLYIGVRPPQPILTAQIASRVALVHPVSKEAGYGSAGRSAEVFGVAATAEAV
jgi:transposase InsO family protein